MLEVVDSLAESRDAVTAKSLWLPFHCVEAVSEELVMTRRSMGRSKENNNEPELCPCAIEPSEGCV